jgi:hypothetical protein
MDAGMPQSGTNRHAPIKPRSHPIWAGPARPHFKEKLTNEPEQRKNERTALDLKIILALTRRKPS